MIIDDGLMIDSFSHHQYYFFSFDLFDSTNALGNISRKRETKKVAKEQRNKTTKQTPLLAWRHCNLEIARVFVVIEKILLKFENERDVK